MPRNLSLTRSSSLVVAPTASSSNSQVTYGNVGSKASPQQQEVLRQRPQRSVSPDLVSKKQLKEQIGQFSSCVSYILYLKFEIAFHF